jgi:maltooligosyltrehalose synthase
VSKTAPVEFNIFTGTGDQENAFNWGDYTSMTVDPVDDCTFWYVNQYLSANQVGAPISWKTRIAKFKLAGCQ